METLILVSTIAIIKSRNVSQCRGEIKIAEGRSRFKVPNREDTAHLYFKKFQIYKFKKNIRSHYETVHISLFSLIRTILSIESHT